MCGTKHCKSCGKDLSVDSFYMHPRGKYGRDSMCKVCKAIYAKRHNAKYPDRVKASALKYNEKHRDENAARAAAWNDAHKEERTEYMKKYYAANAEKMVTQSTHYHAMHYYVKKPSKKQCVLKAIDGLTTIAEQTAALKIIGINRKDAYVRNVISKANK